MQVEIDGEVYEIADETVRDYVAQMDAEDAVESTGDSRYTFGIHVHSTSELDAIGDDIAAFMEKIGEGTFDVQVSVNAKLAMVEEKPDMKVGFQLEPAMGYVQPTEDDYGYEEEDE